MRPNLGRIFSSSEVLRPADRGKTGRAGNNYIIRAAGAVDNQQIAICISTTDNADMGIAGIEHQVAGLGLTP